MNGFSRAGRMGSRNATTPAIRGPNLKFLRRAKSLVYAIHHHYHPQRLPADVMVAALWQPERKTHFPGNSSSSPAIFTPGSQKLETSSQPYEE